MKAEMQYPELFKEEGIKNTRQRRAVLQILEQSEQPLCAEDIYICVKNKEDRINLSTVYRILHFLVEKEILQRNELDNRTLYEIKREEHAHLFFCNGCKTMYKMNACPLGEYAKQVKDELGFDILGHKLELYGLCKDCKSKADQVYVK